MRRAMSCKGPRAQGLWAVAEEVGMVQFGVEDAQDRPYRSLQLSERRFWQGEELASFIVLRQ